MLRQTVPVTAFFPNLMLLAYHNSLCAIVSGQGVLPGLTTALTGISYAPCLFSTSAVGAIAGVTGVGIAPKVFNYGALLPRKAGCIE